MWPRPSCKFETTQKILRLILFFYSVTFAKGAGNNGTNFLLYYLGFDSIFCILYTSHLKIYPSEKIFLKICDLEISFETKGRVVSEGIFVFRRKIKQEISIRPRIISEKTTKAKTLTENKAIEGGGGCNRMVVVYHPRSKCGARLYEYVKSVRGVPSTRNCLHIVSNIDSAPANLFTG